MQLWPNEILENDLPTTFLIALATKMPPIFVKTLDLWQSTNIQKNMRKLVLAAVFGLLGTSLWSQEGFKLGFQGGLPLGDYNDKVGVVLGLDTGYMWSPNKVFDLGAKAGYIYGFPEKFREGTILDEPAQHTICTHSSFRPNLAFKVFLFWCGCGPGL